MKKIIIGLIALFSFSQAFSQNNDTTKYIWYRYTYGNRLGRYWADTVLMIPKDTIWSKDGMALKDGILYTGDHVKWTPAPSRPAVDFQHFVQAADIRDTTITISFPCSAFGSTFSGSYMILRLPQYIGFRVRMSSAVQNIPLNFCEYGTWFDWDQTTGNLYYYSAAENDLLFVQAY